MASGSFELTRTSGSQYVLVWIEYSSTSDIASNTSSITATMKAKRTNTGFVTSGTGTFKISIDGQEDTVTKSYTITSDEVVIMTATKNVTHDNDGTKTITISAEYDGNSPIAGNGSDSNIVLDTIARTSDFTLNSSNVTMGDSVTITINRASNNFIHQVFYSFGSLSWQGLTTSATTSYTWNVPVSLASEIPNATSGTATIIVETYNGQVDSEHYIGSKTHNLTLTVPASVVPTISSVVLAEATSGIASQFGVYVQNKSTLSGTITAAGAYGSTISNYSASLNGNTYSGSTFTTDLLRQSGSNTLQVTVTDSRGRTATHNETFNVAAYTDPNIELFAVSRDETTPSTVAVRIKASISDVNSSNTYSYVIKYKKTSAYSYTSQSVTGTTSVDTTVSLTNIDENSSYDFRLEVTDFFKTIISIKSLSTAFTILDFNTSGKGMAIGKASERNDFEIAMNMYLTKEFYRNGVALDTIINNAITTALAGKFEETIYSTPVSINSSSTKTLTNMPDLTNYEGKTINIYIRYDTDKAKKYSFIIGSSGFFAEYSRDYNGSDIWHTLFGIGSVYSTSWQVNTIHSYVVANGNVSPISITSSNYMFYIEKITIN